MISLAELEGRWSLSRRIIDHRAGLTGRMDGTSVWTPDAEGLVQDEAGSLQFGAAPAMQATRRYLWRQRDADLHVHFDDGRPFHIVPARGAVAEHPCEPDRYRVTYDFETRGAFTATWTVTGPRKDARITSRFRRL